MGAGAQEPNAHKDAATAELTIRQGADGSFSLWSPRFGEGFHSRRGALREARETFLAPSQLERFSPGQRLTVVEVCVGTGTNLALLLEGCVELGLELEWWGLELDPAPLQLALAEPAFRSQWHPQTLQTLETLSERGCWLSPRLTHGMNPSNRSANFLPLLPVAPIQSGWWPGSGNRPIKRT